MKRSASKAFASNTARAIVGSPATRHERKKLWAARKGAFGAIGRIAPDSMIQDAVVPRSRLPEVLAASYRIAAKYQLATRKRIPCGRRQPASVDLFRLALAR